VDNALARVRTLAYAPSGTMTEILAALQAGRTVLSDGPMATFGIDRTGDGTLGQPDDVQVGSRVQVPAGGPVVLRVEWESTAEFGDLTALRLVRGDATTGDRPLPYSLLLDAEKLSDCAQAARRAGGCRVEVSRSTSFGLAPVGATAYFRLEVETAGGFLAVTNPVWLETVDCRDADQDSFYVGAGCAQLPELKARSVDCDDARGAVFPGAVERCNGVDDDCNSATDEACVDPDAGTPSMDAGPPGTDSGTPEPDAASPEAPDTGASNPAGTTGCGCSASGLEASWPLAALAGLWARRRR